MGSGGRVVAASKGSAGAGGRVVERGCGVGGENRGDGSDRARGDTAPAWSPCTSRPDAADPDPHAVPDRNRSRLAVPERRERVVPLTLVRPTMHHRFLPRLRTARNFGGVLDRRIRFHVRSISKTQESPLS